MALSGRITENARGPDRTYGICYGWSHFPPRFHWDRLGRGLRALRRTNGSGTA